VDKEELKQLLKQAELTKKELAGITGLAPSTVNNWGSGQNVPHWVKSWLENYIMKQKHEKIIEILKDSGACD